MGHNLLVGGIPFGGTPSVTTKHDNQGTPPKYFIRNINKFARCAL